MKFGVVVAVIVVLAGIYFYSTNGKTPADTTGQQSINTTPPDTTGGVAGRDNSNDSLDADAASLDAQMSAYVTDQAAVDQGVNDTPIAQE